MVGTKTAGEAATKPHAAPEATEGDFAIDHVFFSRTDERGIIEAGNRTFQLVSGYDWDEMLGKPHKLVRHPDMPHGVFHLFWSELKKGRPIGAYVVNRTKHDRPYWVYATAMPVEGGYLSVRIKPTSPLLEVVKKEYAALRKREHEEKLSPEDSAEALLARLRELGYQNYLAFEAEAATRECVLRSDALGRRVHPLLRHAMDIIEGVKEMTEEGLQLPSILKQLKLTQVNMGVLASRIETAGGPISAISNIYSHMTKEISGWIDKFLHNSGNAFETMEEAVQEAAFLTATALIQRDAAKSNDWPASLGERLDVAEEKAALIARAKKSERWSEERVRYVATAAHGLSMAAAALKREVMCLGSTRVLCEIESARLTRRSESLEEVVRRLSDLQEEVEMRHGRIEHAVDRVLKAAADSDDRKTPRVAA